MALHSMGPALIVMTLAALGVAAVGEAPSAEALGPALKYWEKKLPGVAMPSALRGAISPVEGSPLAALFATQIQHGTLYPSLSASFCKKAGLVCDDKTLHTKYRHRMEQTGHTSDKDAYTYKGDKDAYTYKGDKDAYTYKGDKDAYTYKGDKDAYTYKGDKDAYTYKGDKDAYTYKGDKDAYTYKGDKDAYNYKGDKDAYRYKGDAGAYTYKGDKDAYRYKGDAGAYTYKGDKDAYTYKGDKDAYTYKGDEHAYNYKGDESGTPSKGYFLDTNLAVGAVLRLKEEAPVPAKSFIPKLVADSLPPVTPASLSKLQRIFNIQEGTDMYNVLDFVTSICDDSIALEGEQRICPTSLESFVDFLASHIGPDAKVLTSSSRPRTVMGPMKITNFTVHHSVEDNLSVVICHTLNFPSQMYMCHSVPGTKAVEATMTDADGVEVRATGICHLETKEWSPTHQSFRILGTKPGTTVCHWNDQQALVWYSSKLKESSVIREVVNHASHMSMDMNHEHHGMGM